MYTSFMVTKMKWEILCMD